MSGDEHDEGVGSLAHEAARLAAAFATWTTQHGADLGHQVHDVAGAIKDQVCEGVKDADDHFATGSAECRVCPVCRTVAAVREVSPEVRAHLVSAASSLVAAASGLLATVVDETRNAARADAGEKPSPRSARQDVQRIDLDDE